MMDKNKLLRGIWGGAKELGMDEDTVRALLRRETGKDSMKECTEMELLKVCKAMGLFKQQGKAQTGRLTDKQLKYIKGLAKRMGWDGQPERLRGFVKKYAGVDQAEWLDPKQASKVIEGLKKLAARLPEGVTSNV